MASSKKMYPRRVLALLPIPIVLILSKPDIEFLIPGLLVVAAGEWIRLWAAGHLRKNQEVITSGPYAYVRNPLYVGTFLIGLGFAIAASGVTPPGIYFLLIGVPFFIVYYFAMYLPYKCKVETSRLERRFQEEAADYNEKVPAFFPRLTPYPSDKRKWRPGLTVENSEIGALSAVLVCAAVLTLKCVGALP